MRWRNRRRSSNIEDRRGQRRGGGRAAGGVGTLLLVLAAVYFGVDPRVVLNLVDSTQGPATVTDNSYQPTPAEQEMADLVAVVLADTEDVWNEIFRRSGRSYREPRLVLFSGATRSACGLGQAAMGPFYCPADNQVYIDLSFYDDLRRRHGAPGDFAQAYVIAHEVGHHVQNLLGISERVHSARQRLGKAQGNQLSVRQELQADCYAGLWANHADRAKQILEAGDVEEALTAASAIGDDRLQKQARGRVVPESFTHGSSAQRVRWFQIGLRSGRLADCDTFNAERL